MEHHDTDSLKESRSGFEFRPLSQGLGLGSLVENVTGSSTQKVQPVKTRNSAPPKQFDLKPNLQNSPFNPIIKKTERSFVEKKEESKPSLSWKKRLIVSGFDFFVSILFCLVFFSLIGLLLPEDILEIPSDILNPKYFAQGLMLVYVVYIAYILSFRWILGETLGYLLVYKQNTRLIDRLDKRKL